MKLKISLLVLVCVLGGMVLTGCSDNTGSSSGSTNSMTPTNSMTNK